MQGPHPRSYVIFSSPASLVVFVTMGTRNADGYNFGANIGSAGGAGIADHIHFHVVPRWNGDKNFMPIIGETKVQVQGLQKTYDELIIHFDKLTNN